MDTRSSDTSSSEDEEDKARLQEAVFDTQLLSTGRIKAELRSDETKILDLPSKRPDKETADLDNFDNTLNTTPGFRKHVSRKLSEALESEIDSTDQCFPATLPNVDQSKGVKLFSSSTKLLLEAEPLKQERRKVVRKKPQSSSDSSSEDERLAEASVSHDFIMQQRNLPFWTNQKPADFVINQSDKGQTLAVKKDISNDSEKTDSSRSGCETLSQEHNVKHDGTNSAEKQEVEKDMNAQVKKCKKKKKKKHKKEKLDLLS